ncbi:MAG: alpha-L-fucosidase [Pirellulales bacterium]|nr:alpha-L-fucosidase [Pirellulales bacterium]
MTSTDRRVVLVLAASAVSLGLSLVAGAVRAEPQPAAPDSQTPGQRDARIAWWRDARFGMFIHWGPVSLTEKEISWSRANSNPACPNRGPIPVEEYDNLYKRFNPTKFDARQWAALAKAAGMKYVVLTAKHCDGFLLWDSKVSDYNIMHTPFGRDVCAELAEAVRAEGLKIGWYFSPMDWRDPDCRTERNAEFTKRMQAEIAELLTHYGKIDVLWFDYDGGPVPWDQERTYALVRRLQPQILITNRLDVPGGVDAGNRDTLGPNADYYTPEQYIGGFDRERPWESCMTTSRRNQWSWGGPGDGVKTLEECLNMLVFCAAGDGNVLLNVGPTPAGEIPPEQASLLKKIGAWLAQYGESIHGARGGPYRPSGDVCSTCKDNVVYVHAIKWTDDDLVLAALPKKIRSAGVLGGGEVTMTEQGNRIVFRVDKQDRQPYDTILRLELDGSAEDIAPMSVRPASLTQGKKAAASNVYQNDPTYGADKAVDGDPGTRWATDGGVHQAWLEVDLGWPATFTRAWLGEEFDRVRSFQLEYKDGDAWKPFHKGTTIGAERATAAFAPVTARHVRLNVLDATDGPTITEFELR